VDPGLSIAISCNAGSAKPKKLAQRVADHYLADQLGPKEGDDDTAADEQVVDAPSEPRILTDEQLAEFAGVFFAFELDATYRFAVADGGLVVRIEQEPPLEVVPVADDQFEIEFRDSGSDSSGPQPVSLEFDRNRAGAITGFGLSSASERGIVFERR
jgi:hypothetical protein